MRRPLAMLVFRVCNQHVVLVGKKLEGQHFLDALRQCEQDARKRGAMKGTLDYLETVMEDFVE